MGERAGIDYFRLMGDPLIKDKNIMRKMDIVFGVILVLLGMFFAWQSYKMPWNGISGGGVLAAPGLLPLIISIVLMLCGVILIVSAVKEGTRITKEDLKAALKVLKSKAAVRIYVMLVIIAGYIFGLVGRIEFTLATFIFLSVFFLYVKAGKWWGCLILAAVVAVAISFAFGTLIGIPLP